MGDRAGLEQVVDDSHEALDAFFNGDPEPMKAIYSHGADVSLANPFGPPAVGWPRVADTMTAAAAHYRDGGATSFERVAEFATPDLAYIVEIENYKAKVGGRAHISSVALRVTTVLRFEEGSWKIVHRHADPITTDQPAESVIEP